MTSDADATQLRLDPGQSMCEKAEPLRWFCASILWALRGARRVNSEVLRALEVRQYSQTAIRNRCDEWQYLAEGLVQGIDRSNVLNSPDIIPCPREFPIPQPLISYFD